MATDPPIVTTIRKVLMPTSHGRIVEVRKFNDTRLQDAVNAAIEKAERSGKKNSVFVNYNLNGEIKAGVSVRLDDHWSFGGFLEKRPGKKPEGMAEAVFAF